MGISEASRKNIGALFSMQKEGVSIETGLKIARGFHVKGFSEQQFRTEMGIVASAREKWRIMDTFKGNELVETGYQRVFSTEKHRYRTVVKMTVLDRRTGETYDTYANLDHNRLLQRNTLDEKARVTVKESAWEYLELLDSHIVGGFRRR